MKAIGLKLLCCRDKVCNVEYELFLALNEGAIFNHPVMNATLAMQRRWGKCPDAAVFHIEVIYIS